jgi:hypothetical protein
MCYVLAQGCAVGTARRTFSNNDAYSTLGRYSSLGVQTMDEYKMPNGQHPLPKELDASSLVRSWHTLILRKLP